MLTQEEVFTAIAAKYTDLNVNLADAHISVELDEAMQLIFSVHWNSDKQTSDLPVTHEELQTGDLRFPAHLFQGPDRKS